jgi:hypothetical protein
MRATALAEVVGLINETGQLGEGFQSSKNSLPDLPCSLKVWT